MSPSSKDYLFLHLQELPYFRSLMRAVEASFYPQIELPRPILDVGCGDGHFVTIALDQPPDVGLDPWWGPLGEARRRGGYRALVCGSGGSMPFPAAHFGSAFSNSVLEHIPDVDAVLRDVGRVLKPGAPFAFCGPNDRFLQALSLGRFLDRLGLRSAGDAYRAFFNRISRHYHCDSVATWQTRLQAAGFSLERWWHYYPPDALQATEWGHYFGLPALLVKKLTGRWILSHTRWNLALTDWYARRHYTPGQEHPDGVCTFYIARRALA